MMFSEAHTLISQRSELPSLSRDVLVYFSDFIVWYVQPNAAVETLAPMYEMCIYHTINTANI